MTYAPPLLLALCWSDVLRRGLILVLWASLLWMTAGPQDTPLWIIAAAMTLQTAACLALFALAVRVGRRTSDAAPTAPVASPAGR